MVFNAILFQVKLSWHKYEREEKKLLLFKQRLAFDYSLGLNNFYISLIINRLVWFRSSNNSQYFSHMSSYELDYELGQKLSGIKNQIGYLTLPQV